MSRGVLVLGMHRSGTSLTASLISAWGAYAGEHHLIPADTWNPAGYWEYLPLVRLNMDLLNAVGARTMIPPSDSESEQLAGLAASKLFRQRALALVEEMHSTQQPWFWKDPRMSILLPFWQPLLGDTAYVIVVRPPSEVAESLLKRTPDLPRDAALLVWHRYMTQALRWTSTAPRKIIVNYAGLISSPPETCAGLCGFLDDALLPSRSDTSEERTGRMIAAINPSLYRNRRVEADRVPPSHRSLYALLTALPSRPDKFPDLSGVELDSGWHACLSYAARHCIDFAEQAVAD